MRESFEPSPDLAKELQEAMQQKQGEALLENAKIIEEYQDSGLDEDRRRGEEHESRHEGYRRGRREHDDENRERETIAHEEIVESKLTKSMSRMLHAGLLEEIKDHKNYPELIHDPEVQKVAINFFNQFCVVNKVVAAIQLKEIFEIPDDKCADGISAVITNVFEKEEGLKDINWTEPRRGGYDDYHPDYDDSDRNDDNSEPAPRQVYKLPPNPLEGIINSIPETILKSDQVQRAVRKAYAHRISELLKASQYQGGPRIPRDLDFLISKFGINQAQISSSKEVLDAASALFKDALKEGNYQGTLPGTGILTSVLQYQKYFVTPQFYNLKSVKDYATRGIYSATLLPNFPQEDLEAAKKKFNVSEKNIEAEARLTYKDGIKELATGYSGKLKSTVAAIKYLKIPENEIEDDFVASVLETQSSRNRLDRPGYLMEIGESLGLKNLFNRPEIQKVIQDALVKILKHYMEENRGQSYILKWLEENKEVQELKSMLKSEIDTTVFSYLEEIVLNGITNSYSNSTNFAVLRVFFSTPSPQLESLAKKAVLKYVMTPSTYSSESTIKDRLMKIPEMVKGLGLTNDVLKDPEIQSLALNELMNLMPTLLAYYSQKDNNLEQAHLLCKNFGISKEDLESLVIAHIKQMSENGAARHEATRLEEISSKLHLSPKTLNIIANLVFKSALLQNDEKRARAIKDAFKISGEIPSDAEFKGKEKDYLIIALGKFDFEQVKTIVGSSDDQVTKSPEVIEAAYKMWTSLISSGRWDKAIELLGYIPVPNEMISSLEARKSVIAGFLTEIKRGNNEVAVNVYKEFLSDLSIPQISDLMPQTKPFVEVLQAKFPNLYQKYVSSIEMFISIVPSLNEKVVQILEAHPFLAQALENNNQFALKLLFKFDSFDKLSKANIAELYGDKEKVLADRPGIDPNSRDFRIAMQNYLMPYRRNEEILNSMRKFGIDAEEWLNHEDEMFFELGESSNVLVSEQIQLAVDRTSESVDKAIEICRTIIAEYQKELMEGKVPTIDENELRRQLEEMGSEKEKAVQAGNDKKAQGISKGMKNIEDQLENPKLVPAWTKFVSELSRLSIVKKDIVKLNEDLKAKELEQKELDTKESNPRTRRKEQQKIKGQIEKIKKDIAEKNALLVNRFHQYPGRIEDILKKVLGDDRASAIVQEINQSQGEILDHLVTDNGTIEATVNPKKENDLDDTTMRISVWDRNPDVDLYMGNYTDCCIRIDSAHMGEESTIADYMTDLGIQIVAIYDEKKEVPVAAAWCWVGHDDDDNRALVIDNVEADKGYGKHKKQLEEKLKEYIESYARKSKLGKVVQGKLNNDLVVAQMDSSYYKLGGYNRASGYFLEAENDD